MPVLRSSATAAGAPAALAPATYSVWPSADSVNLNGSSSKARVSIASEKTSAMRTRTLRVRLRRHAPRHRRSSRANHQPRSEAAWRRQSGATRARQAFARACTCPRLRIATASRPPSRSFSASRRALAAELGAAPVALLYVTSSHSSAPSCARQAQRRAARQTSRRGRSEGLQPRGWAKCVDAGAPLKHHGGTRTGAHRGRPGAHELASARERDHSLRQEDCVIERVISLQHLPPFCVG